MPEVRIRVKICGITQLDDALFCVKEGVDALGFVFYRGSPRYISPLAVQRILKKLPPFVSKVGVFVNASRREILNVIKTTGVDCVQLHGEESQDLIDFLRRSIKVIKALRISSEKDMRLIHKFKADGILLDTYVSTSFGGTGRSFEWRWLEKVKDFNKYIVVSGGITPYNINRLLAVYKPFAIDCSSGVEERPGIKDREKIKLLMRKVRSYATSR